MEKHNKLFILQHLQLRNAREHSFKDIIKYSNKLLEKLDAVQKSNLGKLQAIILDHNPAATQGSSHALKVDDTKLKIRCENLHRELNESHAKISTLAEQFIRLKDELDVKKRECSRQTSELENTLSKLKSSQELCKSLKSDLDSMKKALQFKTDDYDTLNITFSSIENAKNDLEIENKKLRTQLSVLMEARRKSLSSDSVDSVFSNASTGSNKNLSKIGEKEDIHPAKRASPKVYSEMRSARPDGALPDTLKFQFIAHKSEVNAVFWFPNPAYLITAGSDRKVKLWEICEKDVNCMKVGQGSNSSITSIDIDSEANLVLCASGDFASRVWTISDFTLRHTLTGHSGKVMSSKFINDSYKIVSGSTDGTLKFWEVPRKVSTLTLNARSPVNDVLSKDTNTIISGHNDSKIRFWDGRTDKEVASIRTSGKVTSLDVSKNLLLASEQSNKLTVFDIRTRKEVKSMAGRNFEIGCDWTRAKFSPGGKYCCCGSKNGSVFIWNTSTGSVERELKAHNSNVISCNWSLCGLYLATCESDKKCVIWCK